jgi:hypothetical protein
MSLVPYQLTRRKLFVLFTLPVFFLFAFRPARLTMAARVEPCVPWASWLAGEGQIRIPLPVPGKSEAEMISKSGPLFPAIFNMSNFTMRALMKGDWPVVFDYELERESTAIITISGKNARQPFVIELPPTNDQRAEVIRRLPAEFGQKLQVGQLSFQAFKTGPEGRQPAHFYLHGIGMGPAAVGSMVINQLHFQPGQIRPKLKEKASYSFHSLADFDSVSADFLLVTSSPGGVISSRLAGREMLADGVRRDKTVARHWDGRNINGQVSQGPHQFQVRVWRSSKKGGDWASAIAKQIVRVE